MKQLSGLDASFLALETANAPMHIAGVSILDPRTAGGGFDLDALRRLVVSRLHVSRTLHQKLAPVPLGLGRPYWIEADDFDVAAHVERTRLPAPGGLRELSALVSWELAQQLDRERPLWHMLLVEGLDSIERVPPGSVALIARIHHAAVDGVSGSEIMSVLFDPSPEPREVVPPAPAESTPPPGKLDLLRRAGQNLVSAPGSWTRTLRDSVESAVKSGAAWGLQGVEPPPLPFTAPRSRLNAPVSARRTWTAALLRLERIKAIRKRTEATVNDVVLAVCAGALRRYLLEKDDLPEDPLVAMVPVSVRTEDEKGSMGNQVSAMLVSLATDEADPAERLRKIRSGATRSKVYHQAIGARTLGDATQFIPFALAQVGARLYAGLRLADRHKPIFNLVITNVPGPQVPLYVAGARLLAHAGAAPIFDGLGLILPVFSYAGTLSIGALSCPEMLPDIDVLAGHFRAALDELESAVAD